jgi:hypothetical protein
MICENHASRIEFLECPYSDIMVACKDCEFTRVYAGRGLNHAPVRVFSTPHPDSTPELISTGGDIDGQIQNRPSNV